MRGCVQAGYSDFSSMTQEYDSFNLKSLRQTFCAIFELADPVSISVDSLPLLNHAPKQTLQPLTVNDAKELRSPSVALQEPWAALS